MWTEERNPDLAELSEQLVQWPRTPRMPRAELRVWLKTARPLRALVPTRIAVARAERKGRRLWEESEAERAGARRTMEAVVCGTPREHELEEHARLHLVEQQAWNALFWQSWPTPQVDQDTRERLVRICKGERGVLLSACHLGPYFRKSKTLRSLGINPYVVTGDWFLDKPTNDYWGRRLARWRKGLPNVPLVRPRGSFPLLKALLARGECVLLYFDLPGSHETPYLGKPVTLSTGTARLAIESDALVLPVRSRRDRHTIRLQAFEPLDPRDFADADVLHRALADVHGRLILDYPAASADQREYGWGDDATPQAWRRPGTWATRRPERAAAPSGQPAIDGRGLTARG